MPAEPPHQQARVTSKSQELEVLRRALSSTPATGTAIERLAALRRQTALELAERVATKTADPEIRMLAQAIVLLVKGLEP